MKGSTLLLATVAMVGTTLLTPLVRRYALARGMLDLPNRRSSHSVATPRGGGVAIVVVVTPLLAVLLLLGIVPLPLFLALAAGGAAIALVGFLDDRHKLPARVRFSVHVVAAVWAVAWVGGLQTVRIGDQLIELGWFGSLLAVVGVVWVTNLFNFMDGIDGIAATEALCVAAGGALIALTHGSGGIAAPGWVLAGGCAGFLCWNWPPARVFLGDVGSGYLGYVIIVLALADSAVRPGAIWEWFILGALFFVDATLTLLRRLFRGERVHEAHRQHAYQRLSRRWGSHRSVTLLVLAANLLWLFPCAMLASRHPSMAISVAVVACLPLLLGSLLLGAGKHLE